MSKVFGSLVSLVGAACAASGAFMFLGAIFSVASLAAPRSSRIWLIAPGLWVAGTALFFIGYWLRFPRDALLETLHTEVYDLSAISRAHQDRVSRPPVRLGTYAVCLVILGLGYVVQGFVGMFAVALGALALAHPTRPGRPVRVPRRLREYRRSRVGSAPSRIPPHASPRFVSSART